MTVSFRQFFFITALGILSSARAMVETPAPVLPAAESGTVTSVAKKEPRVYIVNDTDYKLLVRYREKNKPFIEKDLAPKERLTIKKRPYDLEELYITPSGEWLSKTQLAAPKNLAEFREISLDRNASPEIHVVLSQAATAAIQAVPLLGHLVSPFTRRAEQYLTPFTFAHGVNPPESTGSITPQSKLIFDAFPGVVYAQGKPTARHILGIPKNASLESIDTAYDTLKEQWEQEKDRYPVNTAYVDKVLELLEGAYKKTRTARELKDMIAKDVLAKFAYKGQ